MNDDPIGGALRALPREAAEPGFTAEVLARLDSATAAGRPGGGRSGLRPLWAGAALAAAGLAAFVGLTLMSGPERPRPAPDAPDAAAVSTAAPSRPLAIAAEPPASVPPVIAETPSTPAPPPIRAAAQPPRPPRPAPPAVAAIPAGTTVTAGPVPSAAVEAARLFRARAELAELRRRHDRFASELREISDLAGGRPVVYLGGDEGLDVVLDLRRPTPSTVPASLNPTQPRYR